MDPKPIVAALVGVALLTVHLSTDPPAEPVRTDVVPVEPAAEKAADDDLFASQAERREEHFDKFRDDVFDTSAEKGQKALYRRMTLQGQNPVEVTDAPEFGGSAVKVGESAEDLRAFLDEGGSVRRSSGTRPSQLRRKEGGR